MAITTKSSTKVNPLFLLITKLLAFKFRLPAIIRCAKPAFCSINFVFSGIFLQFSQQTFTCILYYTSILLVFLHCVNAILRLFLTILRHNFVWEIRRSNLVSVICFHTVCGRPAGSFPFLCESIWLCVRRLDIRGLMQYVRLAGLYQRAF